MFNAAQRTTYDESPDVIYAVDDASVITYTNPAWDSFARANGGDALVGRALFGRPLFDFSPATRRSVLAPFYRERLATRALWTHEYECSSPDMQRFFQMRAYPMAGVVVIVNALRIERARRAAASTAAQFRDVYGFVHQCAHCRCVRVPGTEAWSFAPSLVEHPDPATSHALCGPCLEFHYPA